MIIDGVTPSSNIIDHRTSSVLLGRIYKAYYDAGLDGVDNYLTYQEQGKKDKIRITYFILLSIVIVLIYFYYKTKK